MTECVCNGKWKMSLCSSPEYQSQALFLEESENWQKKDWLTLSFSYFNIKYVFYICERIGEKYHIVISNISAECTTLENSMTVMAFKWTEICALTSMSPMITPSLFQVHDQTLGSPLLFIHLCHLPGGEYIFRSFGSSNSHMLFYFQSGSAAHQENWSFPFTPLCNSFKNGYFYSFYHQTLTAYSTCIHY